jgi:hypothetical protein
MMSAAMFAIGQVHTLVLVIPNQKAIHSRLLSSSCFDCHVVLQGVMDVKVKKVCTKH